MSQQLENQETSISLLRKYHLYLSTNSDTGPYTNFQNAIFNGYHTWKRSQKEPKNPLHSI